MIECTVPSPAWTGASGVTTIGASGVTTGASGWTSTGGASGWSAVPASGWATVPASGCGAVVPASAFEPGVPPARSSGRNGSTLGPIAARTVPWTLVNESPLAIGLAQSTEQVLARQYSMRL